MSQLPSAEECVNDPLIEQAWAIKAFHQAETYWNLLTAIPDKKRLKLTP